MNIKFTLNTFKNSKNKLILLNYSKKMYNILNLLFLYNYIEVFFKLNILKKEFMLIKPNSILINLIKNNKIISYNDKYISYKQLKTFILQNNIKLCILSTDKGYLSHHKALALKISGVILCIIKK